MLARSQAALKRKGGECILREAIPRITCGGQVFDLHKRIGHLMKTILMPLVCSLFFQAFAQEEEAVRTIRKVLTLEVHSAINPATLNYLKSSLERANYEKADLILLKLSTPGGLVSVTKDILSLFGSSDIPFAVWITPEGSSATSAGAIVASGAHVLTMSEGTNMGAATPIQFQGSVEEGDVRNKAVNDLVALVQGLAEVRGRNPTLFGEMIEKATSFKALEAQEKRLIDGVVNSEEEFFSFLDGRTIRLKGKDITLRVPVPPVVVRLEMDSGQRLLNIFGHPNLAYILFLIGAALLYLELQAPGGFIAGSLGAIALVLSAIGLQVLPLNFGALGLIILAFVFFALEVFITSYGLLSLAGTASLVFGSLFLYRTEDSYLSLGPSVIFSAVGSIIAFLAVVLFIMIRERKNIGATVFNAIGGKKAKIVAIVDGPIEGRYTYQVRVGGELWKADSEQAYAVGDSCTVKDRKGLLLEI